MNAYFIKCALVAIFILIAVITDYREYKIKNKHIMPFLISGLLLNGLVFGLSGLLDSLYGLLIPLALFPLFMLKMLGGGDIKALCAIGAIVGFTMSIYTVLFSIVAGGVIALVFMLMRKNAWQRFKKLGIYLKQCFYLRKLLPYDRFVDEKSGFRFSLGIAGGFILTIINNTLA
ncbi:MAG: prepilin peptidase [Clostridiales bacterium]|nr:prepilin peptidase [Clostridiales bacterium]